MESLPQPRRTFYTIVVKRCLDILLSGFALLVLSPLLLMLVILELIFHGRPIFYSQKRPGLHGKIFSIYKFRSMSNQCDEQGNLLPGSQRLTAFGRFIRRYSLDELPELWCILKGDMSIIGPRPLLPEYLPYYTPRHMQRHSVRPGLTCEPLHPMKTWTWNDQFENDLDYIQHMSFCVDVAEVFAVFRAAMRGSEYRVEDTRGGFNGKNLYSDAETSGKEHQKE